MGEIVAESLASVGPVERKLGTDPPSLRSHDLQHVEDGIDVGRRLGADRHPRHRTKARQRWWRISSRFRMAIPQGSIKLVITPSCPTSEPTASPHAPTGPDR